MYKQCKIDGSQQHYDCAVLGHAGLVLKIQGCYSTRLWSASIFCEQAGTNIKGQASCTKLSQCFALAAVIIDCYEKVVKVYSWRNRARF